MLKSTLQFLVTIKLLFTFQINTQPGIKLRMNTSALQSSKEDIRPFLVYEVLWLQDGTSNPEFGLQLGIFYSLKLFNLFNPTTTILYQVSELSLVTVKVYDVLGNEISTLINEEKPAGAYEVKFRAADLPSGIYFYKLNAGKFTKTNKMILLK